MDLTVDCHDIEVTSTGMNTHALRVELREVDTNDLNDEDVYDALDLNRFYRHREKEIYDTIDVEAFCLHHGLELKED